MPQPLSSPLSLAQLRTQADAHGYVTVIIPVDLSDLIRGDIDALNDRADACILGPECVPGLVDMSYSVVGHAGDTLHIQVVADASEVLSELDANDEEQDGSVSLMMNCQELPHDQDSCLI